MERLFCEVREAAAALLADPRLITACQERDMGGLFRLLNHRGVSTRKIAAAVNVTQGRLYDYMNGRTRVEKLVMFEQIADALHLPGEFLGLARRSWEPRTTEPDPQPTGPQADSDDVTTLDAFRAADRQTGGGRLYCAVRRHLSRRIAPRLVDSLSGPQIFAAAAAHTEMAGWMAHDSGYDRLARTHFDRALSLAGASGDRLLIAHVSASISHLALQAGEPADALHWARSGLETVRTGPHMPALIGRLHAMQARALAACGQGMPAVAEIDRAREALDIPADGAHPWISQFDEASHASEATLVWQDLHQLGNAAQQAQCAVSLRGKGRVRSLALSHIVLAGIHAQRLDLDAAVRVGLEVLATDPALGSVRVIHQLAILERQLGPHRDYRPVADCLVRLDDARRTRMLLLADVISLPAEGFPA